MKPHLSRRRFLSHSAAFALANHLPGSFAVNSSTGLDKIIPKSKERIPALGMGTWITFNVGNITSLRKQRSEVLQTFFQMGGAMVDSSPMYGSSEAVVGDALNRINGHKSLFSATKVWTSDDNRGIVQFQQSLRLWGIAKFDLMQVHNLLNWRNHLALLQELKSQGLVRYIGITTSHGRRHDELLHIMQTYDIDFIQLTLNIDDNGAENRLLPTALDNGIAVIANRPFQGGRLPQMFANSPLPALATDYECDSWPQLLLKYVISHPALTCAIPATTQVAHMRENMSVLQSRILTQQERAKLLQLVRSM
ncbi:MAG: aldo/keto reductase [Aestuariibacter sp.]